MLSLRCISEGRFEFAFLLGLFLAMPAGVFPQAQKADSLETATQANARIEQLARKAPRSPMDTTIGPGDLIHVDVFDVPDLSHDVRVSLAGNITMPLIPGRIHVGGLTPFQAQDEIAKMLAQNGLVRHPQVSVLVKEQNSQSISVVGAVQQPGVYQEARPVTVLEALARAGGLAKDAGSEVLITRPVQTEENREEGQAGAMAPVSDTETPPSKTITIEITDLLETGDPKYNVPVYGGDILTVPRAGIIYVAGAVQIAGGYTIPNSEDHMTILKALALARGATLTAKLNDALILRKMPNGKTEEIKVRLKDVMSQKTPDLPLYANDILFVPDSGAKRAFYKAANAAVGITSGVIVYRSTQ